MNIIVDIMHYGELSPTKARVGFIITVLLLSSMPRQNAADSTVHERTVSVLPSLNSLVIQASYVKQNLPASWGEINRSLQG